MHTKNCPSCLPLLCRFVKITGQNDQQFQAAGQQLNQELDTDKTIAMWKSHAEGRHRWLAAGSPSNRRSRNGQQHCCTHLTSMHRKAASARATCQATVMSLCTGSGDSSVSEGRSAVYRWAASKMGGCRASECLLMPAAESLAGCSCRPDPIGSALASCRPRLLCTYKS
jgi:hypothetical protein